MRRAALTLLAVLVAIVAVAAVPRPAAHADMIVIATRVSLNGVPTPVYFNDGDSFRVLAGPHQDTKARLEGFNTLESFGGVHRWGTWDPWELYINAKEATLNGRRGVWHCTSADLHTDGYGRILWECPDLAVAQIRAGLAHVYSATEEPGHWPYIRAQREAIAAHRGMWAHGVPEFIVTSVHSSGESGPHGSAYNRMISVADGHSEPWEHNESYRECQNVCALDVIADPARLDAVSMRLRSDAEMQPAVAALDNIHLSELVSMFARIGRLPDWVTPAQSAPLTRWLTAVREHGDFGTLTRRPGSCMVYVPFNRRYGTDKASCLVH